MRTATQKALEQTHQALNDLLAQWILMDASLDFIVVEQAISALAANTQLESASELDLPITAGFYDRVQQQAERQKETKK